MVTVKILLKIKSLYQKKDLRKRKNSLDAILFAPQSNFPLLHIPYVKMIIITHHSNFLMKLGLKAGDIFESVNVKSNSSTRQKYKEECREKGQSAKWMFNGNEIH